MRVVVVTHPAGLRHDAGEGHPERAARIDAALAGVRDAGLGDQLVWREADAAPRASVEAVHEASVLDRIEALASDGGGRIDADTTVSAASYEAATAAAGAGLTAARTLDTGEADAAFCVVRPPGHHATRARSMGFCLINSVAVLAMARRAAGARVAIVDLDAHHGNGTQDIFAADDQVLFVSLHQSPLYPGTGAREERGVGGAVGTTVNIPVPPGTTGDVYADAFDRVVLPVLERFGPDHLVVSLGFDAHRRDPLTSLALTSADYGDLVARLVEVAGPGRLVAFLEGGYDLDAVRACAHASTVALAGVRAAFAEPPSRGGPGRAAVDAAVAVHLGGAPS